MNTQKALIKAFSLLSILVLVAACGTQANQRPGDKRARTCHLELSWSSKSE
jgi:hypothetical protein